MKEGQFVLLDGTVFEVVKDLGVCVKVSHSKWVSQKRLAKGLRLYTTDEVYAEFYPALQDADQEDCITLEDDFIEVSPDLWLKRK